MVITSATMAITSANISCKIMCFHHLPYKIMAITSATLLINKTIITNVWYYHLPHIMALTSAINMAIRSATVILAITSAKAI